MNFRQAGLFAFALLGSCGFSAHLPVHGQLKGTETTISGQVNLWDAGALPDMEIFVGRDVKCSGQLRDIGNSYFEASLACSDLRQAEFRCQINARIGICFGKVGGNTASLTVAIQPVRR